MVYAVDKMVKIEYNATKGCKKCIVKLLVTMRLTCYNKDQDNNGKGDFYYDHWTEDYSTQKCG